MPAPPVLVALTRGPTPSPGDDAGFLSWDPDLNGAASPPGTCHHVASSSIDTMARDAPACLGRAAAEAPRMVWPGQRLTPGHWRLGAAASHAGLRRPGRGLPMCIRLSGGADMASPPPSSPQSQVCLEVASMTRTPSPRAPSSPIAPPFAVDLNAGFAGSGAPPAAWSPALSALDAPASPWPGGGEDASPTWADAYALDGSVVDAGTPPVTPSRAAKDTDVGWQFAAIDRVALQTSPRPPSWVSRWAERRAVVAYRSRFPNLWLAVRQATPKWGARQKGDWTLRRRFLFAAELEALRVSEAFEPAADV